MFRFLVIAALCCCALLTQSIGLLHGYVHPRDGRAQAVSASMAVCAGADSGCAVTAPVLQPSGALPAMFSGHDVGSVGCTLFDLLTHADLLHGAPTLALAFTAPTHPDAVHAAWHHATQATGFLARAPPVTG